MTFTRSASSLFASLSFLSAILSAQATSKHPNGPWPRQNLREIRAGSNGLEGPGPPDASECTLWSPLKEASLVVDEEIEIPLWMSAGCSRREKYRFFSSQDSSGTKNDTDDPVIRIVELQHGTIHETLRDEGVATDNNHDRDDPFRPRPVVPVLIKALKVGETFIFGVVIIPDGNESVNGSYLGGSSDEPAAFLPNNPPSSSTGEPSFFTIFLLRAEVLRSRSLEVACGVVGWLYTFSWCICFYPQLWLLWSTRNGDGFSVDMWLLNVVDQSAMLMQTYSMYFSVQLRHEYDLLHPNKPLPIRPNDLASIAHNFTGMCLMGIMIRRCNKSRNSQKPSRVGIGSLVLSVLAVLIGIVLSAAGVMSWLQTVFILGYIKATIGIIKYAPQAYLNYTRKSTTGLSCGLMLFDMAGGCFSLLQMLLLAINHDDSGNLIGNPGKLGTGLVTVLFEGIFLVQKFIVYRHNDGQGGYEQI